MYGPDGLLKMNEAGEAELNVEGEYLGVQEGDNLGYLQWDSKVDAITQNYEFHKSIIFDMASLSKLLFENEAFAGQITGIALKRLMLPFISKTNDIRQKNNRVINEIVQIINNNLRANGLEIYAYNDVQIDWPYEDIFIDEPVNAEGGTASGEEDKD